MLTLRHILEGRNSHEVIYQISRVITSTFKYFQKRQRNKDVSKKELSVFIILMCTDYCPFLFSAQDLCSFERCYKILLVFNYSFGQWLAIVYTVVTVVYSN